MREPAVTGPGAVVHGRRRLRGSPCVALVPAFLALLLPAVVSAQAAPPTARPGALRAGGLEVDVVLLAGGIASVGTKVPTGNAAGALDLWLTWRTSDGVRFGWRVGLIVGGMKWGRDTLADNIWTPGFPALPDYQWRATFLPHSGLVLAFDVFRRVAVDLGFGVATTLVGAGNRKQSGSDRDGGMNILPCLMLGAGTTIDLAILDHYVVSLAIRLDYVGSWLNRSKGTFAPQIGVQFRL